MAKKQDEQDVDQAPSKRKKSSGPIAKKDHVLHQNEFHFECVKGSPIPDGIPDSLMVALKTEGVID